ncbi:MAG: hypothetical protein JEZ09_15020 [Salinivirgaceae bacterium]|nr:hypothetical protein [Salinivirgaceae bacterium]
MNKRILSVGMTAMALAFLFFMGTSCNKDDDNVEDSNTGGGSKYEIADFVGKWASNAYSVDVYVQLNKDGSGEMTDPNEDYYNITWTLGSIELDSLNTSTGELVEYEEKGIKLTDEDGYYYELKIVEQSGTISSLVDVTNNITYTKSTSGDGDDDGDGDGDDDDEITTYEIEDVARKWASDAYIDEVYVLLQSDGSGEMTETDGTLYNITWEFAEIEISSLDTVTLEIEYSNIAGVKVTDPEGYYVELVIEEENDTIQALFDNSNIIRYKRVAMESDEVTKVHDISGKIEFEDYASGGEGITYHVNSSGNGEAYGRAGSVGIYESADASNGFYVYPSQNGSEWFNYSANVSEEGIYAVKIAYSCEWISDNKPMIISVISGSDTAQITVENNNSVFTEYTFDGYLYLNAGERTITIATTEDTWANIKLDYIEISNENVQSSYTMDDFYGHKFTSTDGVDYIDFNSSDNQFNIMGEYSNIDYDMCPFMVMRYGQLVDNAYYEYNVVEALYVNETAYGMYKSAIFIVVSETELIYMGNQPNDITLHANEETIRLYRED